MTDIGDLYPITVETRKAPTDAQIAAGQPGDLVDVTSVTVTVTTPDGVPKTPVIMTNASTGVYRYDFPTTVSGLHMWSAVSVGLVAAVADDVFVVSDPGPLSIVSVDEVITHMRAQPTMDADDREQLRVYCVAATSAIEEDLHRALVRRVVTETHNGGCAALFLRQTPVLSVTSVVETGVTLGQSGDYVIDPRLGILYRGTAQAPAWFDYGLQSVVVTYLAGMTQPPEFIRKVALNTVVKMWQAAQQLPHTYLDGQLDGAGFVQAATAQLTGPEFRAYEQYRLVSVG